MHPSLMKQGKLFLNAERNSFCPWCCGNLQIRAWTRAWTFVAGLGRQKTWSESFLAQKIEVGVAARARIDDCGKVARKIVSIAVEVGKWKREGDFQRDLGRSDNFAVAPSLPVNRDLAPGRNRIQERHSSTRFRCKRCLRCGFAPLRHFCQTELQNLYASPSGSQ